MFICFLNLPGTFALPTINLLCHLPTHSSKMCNQCFSFFWVLQLSHLIMQHFGSKMVYYKQPAQQAFPLEFLCENCSPLLLPLLLFFPAFLQYLERKHQLCRGIRSSSCVRTSLPSSSPFFYFFQLSCNNSSRKTCYAGYIMGGAKVAT